MSLELKVKLLDHKARVPARALPGDLGFDLFSLDDVVVQPGETITAKTGVAFEFPEGWGALVRPRSSQGKAGITIHAGVVDSGYRGEVVVLVHNTNEFVANDPGLNSDNTIVYKAGDKIAQLVLIPVFPGTIVQVEELGASERGARGFGSTGR